MKENTWVGFVQRVSLRWVYRLRLRPATMANWMGRGEELSVVTMSNMFPKPWPPAMTNTRGREGWKPKVRRSFFLTRGVAGWKRGSMGSPVTINFEREIPCLSAVSMTSGVGKKYVSAWGVNQKAGVVMRSVITVE